MTGIISRARVRAALARLSEEGPGELEDLFYEIAQRCIEDDNDGRTPRPPLPIFIAWEDELDHLEPEARKLWSDLNQQPASPWVLENTLRALLEQAHQAAITRLQRELLEEGGR